MNTPQPALATAITTGGVSVQVVPPNVVGGFIWNPLTDADQGVTAEPLYVSILGPSDLQGFGSTVALAPGAYFYMPATNITSGLWANATTTGHRFAAVYWVGP